MATLEELKAEAEVQAAASGIGLLDKLIYQQHDLASQLIQESYTLMRSAELQFQDEEYALKLQLALKELSTLPFFYSDTVYPNWPYPRPDVDLNIDTDYDTKLDMPVFTPAPPITLNFNTPLQPQIDTSITPVNFVQPDFFDDKAPDIDVSDIAFDMPDAQPPERPEFFDITLPDPPDLSVLDGLGQPIQDPQFQGSIPQNAAQTYSDRLDAFHSAEIGRFDALMAEFVQKFFPDQEIQRDILDTYIKDFVEGRKTLFTNRVEELIYTRQQNRNDLQYLREREEVLRTAQETSNPIMPARVQAQLLRVSESAAARNTESAIAVTERRLQTEIEQLRFSLQMLYSLRELMLQTRNTEFQAQLTLLQACLQDAAQFASVLYEAADRYIQLYAQDINKARLEIENLARLREDVRLQIDMYIGQLRGAEVQSRINDSIAGRYGTEAQVYATIFQAADSQIRAKIAEAELRKIPLDVFIAKASAYGEYSKGIAAYNDSLKAIIDGDIARISAQEAGVRAWAEGIKGQEIIGRLQLAEQEATIKQNEAKASIAVAQARVKEAVASLKKLAGDAQLAQAGVEIDLYKILSDRAMAEFTTEMDRAIQKDNLRQVYASEFSKLALASNELVLSRNKAIADVVLSSSNIYGSMAQSLFNGINLVINAADILEYDPTDT